MRNIEFRGKRSNGEWIYGSLIALDADSGYVYITKPYTPTSTLSPSILIEGNTYLVDPNTVGQYTGLKDKNGVKIYEGDIVHYDATPYNTYGLDVVGEIVFHKFSWEMMYQKYDMTNFYPIGSEDFFGAKSEVMGNIYDNSELLQGDIK